jgi:GH15 family glucan-1,4-alpha-glucosidase
LNEQSAQPLIEDYAIIGDCRTAALVSRSGSIDWLCLPDFSSPSIFACILDRASGGCWSITPRGRFTSKRQYVGHSCALATTFETGQGAVRVIDLFPILDGANSLAPMRELLRIVEGVVGEVELEIRLEPRPGYGRDTPVLQDRGKLGWCYSWSNELLLARTATPLTPRNDALTGSIRAAAGERHFFNLSYVRNDPGVIPPLENGGARRLDRTLDWWQTWSDQCSYQGPRRDAVLRSALTLKLLCFALSGAIVAAPTMSLPEAIGGERNWDYRYCWLRDAGLTMQALVGLGFHAEARAFLSWLLHATRLSWPRLEVLYDVYGRPPAQEQVLQQLAGYRGSKPVRIGNRASTQLQLDVYGQLVLAAETFISAGGHIDAVEARLLVGLGRTVCKCWREADNSLWEIPDPRRQYTLSKVMCWVALDRLLRLAGKGVISLGSDCERFRRERTAIGELIEGAGFNAAVGSYVSELGGTQVDASLLLMACLDYRHAADPRMIGTYERIVQRLGRDGLLYRYEHGYDGFGSREGTFGICSFWAIDNLARRGDVAAAEHLFDRLLGFANDLGLYAEEIDPERGTALGNFPQAFTHVGVINAALAIEHSRKAAR